MKDAIVDSVRDATQADSLGEALKELYHVPVLGAVIAFMLAVRLRALGNFQTNGGALRSAETTRGIISDRRRISWITSPDDAVRSTNKLVVSQSPLEFSSN